MFWSRKPEERIAAVSPAARIDLDALCRTARLAADRLPFLEAKNRKLEDQLDAAADRAEELKARLAKAEMEAFRLVGSESQARHDAASAQKKAADADWRHDRIKERLAAVEAERDEAIHDAGRIQADYEDMAGALALLNQVALKAMEEFPDEPAAEGGGGQA